MANTQAVPLSYKVDVLNAVHAFGTSVIRASTSADTFKAALYLTTATNNASTSAYSATGEVSGAGYTAGGNTVSFIAPSLSGTVAVTTPTAAITWSGVTLSTPFDCAVMYNSSQANKAVGVFTFAAQTVVSGTFSLNMPVNDAANALFQVA